MLFYGRGAQYRARNNGRSAVIERLLFSFDRLLFSFSGNADRLLLDYVVRKQVKVPVQVNSLKQGLQAQRNQQGVEGFYYGD